MIVLEPGHVYLLKRLESPGYEDLQFIKRNSAATNYEREHPGTNTQEVIRVLINRSLFLNKVIPSPETLDAVYYLRMALFCYEARAWRRKQEKLNKSAHPNESIERYKDIPFNEQDIETRLVGKDGHIILRKRK